MCLNLFIVAGEASSDLHAAQLLKELKLLHPDIKCFGVGGSCLKEQGMEVLIPAARISAFGATDWMERASEILGAYKKTVKMIEERKPDLALLLDLPDFNLRIAKKLKARKIPTAYYFSPQVWAWRKYRLKTIKRIIDRMLVAFPFEKSFYQENGVDVKFVGHPVLESLEARKKYRTNVEIQDQPRIAILPGSRKSELRHHGEILKIVVSRLKARYPNCEVRVPVASTVSKEEVQALMGLQVELIQGKAASVMAWADVALVASGTATLECAVIGTPFALFYRVNAVSAFFYRWLVPYKGAIGMPNILLKQEVAKEFFQAKAKPEALYEELVRLLENETMRTALGQSLLKCRECLGGHGASRRAAVELLRLHHGSKQI